MKNALERMDELISFTCSSNPVYAVNLSEELATCRIRQAMAEKENIRKELMYSTSVFHDMLSDQPSMANFVAW